MTARKLISLASFGIIVLAISLVHGNVLDSDETRARNFLNQTSTRMFNFFDKLVEEGYIFEADVRLNQYKTNRRYIDFVINVAQQARKFDFENFKDEELKFAFKGLAQLADENIIGVAQFSRILESVKELDYLTRYKEIPKYERQNTYLAIYPDVFEIMTKTSDEKEIQYYWTEWKKITGKWAKDNLNITLEGLKHAANLSEVSPLEFWSRGFNITDMEDLLFEMRPLYMELHAFVRFVLQKVYGESMIGPDRLIPDHLFKQFSIQSTARDRVVEELFPSQSLPGVNLAIGEKFTTQELYEIVDEFYASLGFEKYPASMWGDRIRYKTKADEEENDETKCRARVVIKTPNIYMKFCENPDFFDFLAAYNNMAYIYFAKEMVGLPSYYFCSPQGLNYAIGKAMAVSASSSRNFKNIGMIPENVDVPENVELNRVLRMAMRRALHLPTDYVNAKTFAALLSGDVEWKDINEYYWKLLREYAGVKKPAGHVTDTFDFPINVYKEMNDNLMARDYNTEFLAYQILKRLCEISGKYPKEPLHLCVISGSKEAGNALKKMMSLGKSKPFWKVLATMFPESPKINADGVLEYYKPIQYMLSKKNKELNLELGWEDQIQKPSHR